MDLKCTVYTIRSAAYQLSCAEQHLLKHWVAKSDKNDRHNFKKPSEAELKEYLHLFPREEKMYDSRLLDFTTVIYDDEPYPSAIVIGENGFLTHVGIDEVKITDAE